MPASLNDGDVLGRAGGRREPEGEQRRPADPEGVAHRLDAERPEDRRVAGEDEAQPHDGQDEQRDRREVRQDRVAKGIRLALDEHLEQAAHVGEDEPGDELVRGPREHEHADGRHERTRGEEDAEDEDDDLEGELFGRHPLRVRARREPPAAPRAPPVPCQALFRRAFAEHCGGTRSPGRARGRVSDAPRGIECVSCDRLVVIWEEPVGRRRVPCQVLSRRAFAGSGSDRGRRVVLEAGRPMPHGASRGCPMTAWWSSGKNRSGGATFRVRRSPGERSPYLGWFEGRGSCSGPVIRCPTGQREAVQ